MTRPYRPDLLWEANDTGARIAGIEDIGANCDGGVGYKPITYERTPATSLPENEADTIDVLRVTELVNLEQGHCGISATQLSGGELDFDISFSAAMQ